jgi:hypothetical protein
MKNSKKRRFFELKLSLVRYIRHGSDMSDLGRIWPTWIVSNQKSSYLLDPTITFDQMQKICSMSS